MDNKLKTINFEAFFLNLLSQLSEREQEVLKKRYQLTSNVEEKHTLKKIGDFYGITRERVRQIEREAINKLVTQATEEPAASDLTALRATLRHFLERKGGVATEQDLVTEYLLANHNFDLLHLNAFLFVLEHLVDGVSQVKESDNFYTFWQLNEAQYDTIAVFVDKVVDTLKSHGVAIEEDKLHDLIEAQAVSNIEKEYIENLLAKHDDLTSKDLVRAFLAITKKVEKNILDQWGLAEWSVIKPKKLGDKIFLIFKHSNEPLHFREVAECINRAKFDHKSICAATVHNELIANDRYVLIGRGIYALKEWGYTPGTVTDIIVKILSESEAMSKEDIYEAVMKQRKVNPSTIYLSLINKDRFKKLPNGFFSLK